MSNQQHQGACFCGVVEFVVSGAPVAAGYCHCQSCRQWSAAPVNAFTLWKPEALRITHGAEQVGTFLRSPASHRKWCKACGGHLFTDHPGMGLVDVYAAMLPGLPFLAGVHVHYGESVLRIRDGLPKFQDLPREMGGSGEILPE